MPCERLGRAVPYVELERAWAMAFEPDVEVLALIASVRPRHRTALLTDNGPILRDAMPHLLPNIARPLDPLLYSRDLRACKPGPDVFVRAPDRLGAQPGEVLPVNDSPAAVAVARAVGMQAIYFTGARRLAETLGIVLGSSAGNLP